MQYLRRIFSYYKISELFRVTFIFSIILACLDFAIHSNCRLDQGGGAICTYFRSFLGTIASDTVRTSSLGYIDSFLMIILLLIFYKKGGDQKSKNDVKEKFYRKIFLVIIILNLTIGLGRYFSLRYVTVHPWYLKLWKEQCLVGDEGQPKILYFYTNKNVEVGGLYRCNSDNKVEKY